jgi:flagellar biogenesis protein FliO
MTPLGRYVVETVITLSAVAALAVLLLYVARRAGVGRPSGPLSIAGRLVLDARRAIYLVRIGEVVYVVGASEAGLAKLGEIPANSLGALPELGGALAPGFRQILEQIKKPAPGSVDSGGSREES